MSESVFFQDLAVVLAIAGLAAVAFSRLKWPKVFGYILVGILMNGHTWGGAFLTDMTSIATISQLGIVFLMFTMGLEFSASDMKRIKNVTIPTAILDTVVMVYLGYMLGTRLLGWAAIPSLFLGVAICDSATTLLAKMIGDLGWGNRTFVKYTMGTSVSEDIICVGLIALVTGLANGSGLSLGAVGLSMGGLFLFFLGTVVFGLVLVPRLLKSIARKSDDEALLMACLGLCFFISWAAYKLNYSLALGAFLVGVIGASSEAKVKLHSMVAPLRTLFAAMFFVSIGLLVDPGACWTNLGAILIVSAVVVVGKTINCFLGAILTGEQIKNAVQMAFSLAQIGEFAFMLALAFVTLTGDTKSALFPVTIGASLLTTLLNPLMLRLSEPVGDWAEAKAPKKLKRALETYRAFLAKYSQTSDANNARHRVRVAIGEIAVIAILAIVLAAGFALLAQADWSRFSVIFERYDRYLFLILEDLFALGLFALILRITETLTGALSEILVGPTNDSKLRSFAHSMVSLFTHSVIIIGFALEILMINSALLPNDPVATVVLMVIVALAGVAGWRFFKRAGNDARKRFDEALAENEGGADLGAMLTVEVPADTITQLTLGADSPAIGETVVTLDIRAKTGASIVSVIRGGQITRNIGPEWVFGIGDTLVALGEGGQIASLKDLLGIT